VLVTEAPAATMPLGLWLQKPLGRSAEALRQRRGLMREAGRVVCRLHEAACYLGSEIGQTARALQVQTPRGGTPLLLVAEIEAIRRRHRPSTRLALRDIRALWPALRAVCSWTDAMRFLLAYLDVARVTPNARQLARHALGAWRGAAAERGRP
jgi:hypothetical protein